MSLNTSLDFYLFLVLDIYKTVSKKKEICWPDVDGGMQCNPPRGLILKNYRSILIFQQGKQITFSLFILSGTPTGKSQHFESIKV